MMRRFALVVCLFAVVATTGCRKKSAPQYYEAQGKYDVLVTRLGDDAYESPELAEIEALLQSVKPNAREAAQAQTLLATIGTEKARVAAETALRNKPIAPPPAVVFPPIVSATPTPGAPTQVLVADAGFQPEIGMKLETFLAQYGACMEPTDDVLMPGAKTPSLAYAVRKTKLCMDRFGGTEGITKMFVFTDKKLAGEATRNEPSNDKPYAGMTSETFLRVFGDCMQAVPDVTMPGATVPNKAYGVIKTTACTDKFGGAGEGVTKAFVFKDGKLVGESLQQAQPKVVEPKFVPGASLPSGVNSALPPPDPSTAFTPDSNQLQQPAQPR